MGMYKGPYAFEFIGAAVRWCLIKLFGKRRNIGQTDLFKEIISGGASMSERSWETFFTNSFIGIAVVLTVVLVAIYIFY